MLTTIRLKSGATESDIVNALKALPKGGTVILPAGETIEIQNGISINVGSRDIVLDLNGSTLKQAGASTVIYGAGATGPIHAVSMTLAGGNTVLKYGAAPQGVAVGDWVKVIADDALPYDHSSNGQPTRLGQALQVISVSGSEVVLSGQPVYADLYKTNVRASEIISGELVVRDGTVVGDQSQSAWKMDLVQLRDTVDAQVKQMTVRDGNAMGINVINSVGAQVVDCTVKNLKDDVSKGFFGYAVHSSSSVGTTVVGLYAEAVRHATDNHALDTPVNGNRVSRYGGDIGFTVRDSVAYTTTNNAWGWHSEGVNGVLDGVMSFDSHGSIGARGTGHRIVDVASVNDQRGILLYEYGKGDGRDMTFDRVLMRETKLYAFTPVGSPTGNTILNSSFEVYQPGTRAGTTTLIGTTVTRIGANEDDVMVGGTQADRLLGGKGVDTLSGGAGDDYVWGGAAADTLTGGEGRDRFAFHQMSEAGDVILDFQAGRGGDLIDLSVMAARYGWSGGPVAEGYVRLVQAGRDARLEVSVDGGDSFGVLATLAGVNAESISAANFQMALSGDTPSSARPTSDAKTTGLVDGRIWDAIFAGTLKADNLTATAGHDLLTADGGDDALDGGAGDDYLNGGAGHDRLLGGEGDDVLLGGPGNDSFAGGTGRDVFVLTREKWAVRDQIADFSALDGDRLGVDDQAFGLRVGAGLVEERAGLALDPRWLAAGAGIKAGTEAHGQFLYNTTTRALMWDADGSGSSAAVALATLNVASLSHVDFLII